MNTKHYTKEFQLQAVRLVVERRHATLGYQTPAAVEEPYRREHQLT
jgi:hypothetical protein